MDLAAVLDRRPQLALVDELAHTNVADPSDLGRQPHALADIEVLLDHVHRRITTLNVQHLESLNDVGRSLTGVRQADGAVAGWWSGGRGDRAGRT